MTTAPKIVASDFDAQFALKHMLKDLELVDAEAKRLGAPLPITSLSLQLYRLTNRLGYGDEDFSAVAKILHSKK